MVWLNGSDEKISQWDLDGQLEKSKASRYLFNLSPSLSIRFLLERIL